MFHRGLFLLTVLSSVVHINNSAEMLCTADDCAKQCYQAGKLNAKCDNINCNCDDDCFRHLRLQPWSDPNIACLKLCLRTVGHPGRCVDGGKCSCHLPIPPLNQK